MMHLNEVRIPTGRATLDGNLTIVDEATALVLFVHGSGSSRHSPRNQFVARVLNNAGLATLLFDLLDPREEAEDMRTRRLRFDVAWRRLRHVVSFIEELGVAELGAERLEFLHY